MNLKFFRQAAIFSFISALIFCAGTLSADMGMSDKRMKKLTKQLGLTKDQSAVMEALNEKGAETAKSLLAKIEDDTKHLKALVKDRAPDPAITAANAVVVADYRRVMEAQMAHQDSMQAILSPAQYAKVLVEIYEHRDSDSRRVGMSIGLGVGSGMGVGMGIGTGY